MQEFFAAMPADSGMAFAVVLHLSPKHVSHLTEILQTQTAMPVKQVTKTIQVEPNNVYVISPDRELLMFDGTIQSAKLNEREGISVAIDHFFRTLADAYGRKAVGIVLSGSGTDGSIGIKRIKENNGFVIVQEPEDAEHDWMPRGAIATQLVDWILPVSEMPQKLIAFRESSDRLHLTEGDDYKISREIKAEEALREILVLLRNRTGHDFTNYKQATLIRRIARHLQIHNLEDIPSYLNFLNEHPEELNSLLKNLLINVTNFFRDKEAFESLEKNVVPKLFAGKTSIDTVRVWSVGCASGEEAYSIAILLTEYAEGISNAPKIQVFATDVDEDAIAQARDNSYPEGILADVSPERLRRFFVKEGELYHVKKDLRGKVLFAPHNVLHDPPFSRLDLIVCRNLMIYLNRETQEKVLKIFHFGLNQGGYLFLGNAETADSLPSLYDPVDKKARIYLHRVSPKSGLALSPPTFPAEGRGQIKIPESQPNLVNASSVSYGELHYKLIEQYAPPSVLVNQDFDIVHLSESAGRFLQFAGGEPTNNIFKIVNPDLVSDLRAALFAAQNENGNSEIQNIHVTLAGKETFVNLIVRFVTVGEAGGDYLLVIFDESLVGLNEPSGDNGGGGVKSNGKKTKRVSTNAAAADDDAMNIVIRGLEENLRRTKERLRLTATQHEISIEELKASNEELQAINEELRSASEELETSKEELQSLNEELSTVNFELKEKLEEISRANSDLQNFMSSTDIATIFLDRSLQIKRYTPSAQQLFNITSVDIGRPLDHFTHHLAYENLVKDAEEVLSSLKWVEREIQSRDGRHYLSRFHPYRTLDDQIDGVVLNFIDITERKRVEEEILRAEEQFRRAIEEAPIPVIMHAEDGEVLQISRTWTELTGYEVSDVPTVETWLNRAYGEGAEAVRDFVKELFKGTKRTLNVDFAIRTRKQGVRFWNFSASSPGKLQDGRRFLVGMAVDVTERRKAEEAARDSETRLVQAMDVAKMFSWEANPETQEFSYSPNLERVLGFNLTARILQNSVENHIHPEDEKRAVRKALQAIKGGTPYEDTIRFINPQTGEIIWVHSQGGLVNEPDGTKRFMGVAQNITESKQAEIALRENEKRYHTLFDLVPVAVYTCDARGAIQEFNRRAVELWGREPVRNDPGEIFCGSSKIFYSDGRPMPHEECPMARVLRGETLAAPQDLEIIIEQPDGTRKNVIVNPKTLKNESGEIIGAINCLYDITETKQAEKALRESEERLRLIMDNAEDYAIMTLDDEGRFTAWNTGAETMFGFSEAEALGQHGEIIFTPEDRAKGEPLRELETALRKGRAADERFHMRKDGTRFYVSGVMMKLRGGNEQYSFAKIARDLTERQQMVEALKEADRRKDEFLATLAHELRNPLAPIRSGLEIIRRATSDRNARMEALGIIERQTNQVVHLVDDLLNISRITQGKIKLKKARMELKTAVEMALETSKDLIETAGHQITITLPPEPIYLDADLMRITQILLNLLNNSVKYTLPGGKVWLSAQKEGGEVVISLRDTGVGIPPDMLSNIFEMFSQIKNTSEQARGGLGIGLSVVKKLVEMHGGSVAAFSDGEGKGSEFVVRLPLAPEQTTIESKETSEIGTREEIGKAEQGLLKTPATHAAAESKSNQSKNRRILVVDDNADAAQMLQVLLSMEGHEVRMAFDAESGIELAEEFQPDVCLLDIGLPEMDGYEAAQKLRQLLLPGALLISISGWGQEEDRRRSREAGFNYHLVKPVEIEDVNKLLAEG